MPKLGLIHAGFGVDGADFVAFRRFDIEELIAGAVEGCTSETERTNGFQMLVRDSAEVARQDAADTESHILSFLLLLPFALPPLANRDQQLLPHKLSTLLRRQSGQKLRRALGTG